MNNESELKAKLYAMIFLEPHENEHQLVDHVINRVLDEAIERLHKCHVVFSEGGYMGGQEACIEQHDAIAAINLIREEL